MGRRFKKWKGTFKWILLESSLQISPKEQVQTMAKIFEGDTNFKKSILIF